MGFEYVKPHDRLLDIRIGTRLSSQLFARIGLDVFGIDASTEMLNMCRSKSFVKELKLFDLQDGPLPYSKGFFDHVICRGVFHFFGDLESIFIEVSRVMKPVGIFAFTSLLQVAGRTEEVEGYEESLAFEAEASVFLHGSKYINKLLQNHSFDAVKQLKFLASSEVGDHGDLLCKAHVARRRVDANH